MLYARLTAPASFAIGGEEYNAGDMTTLTKGDAQKLAKKHPELRFSYEDRAADIAPGRNDDVAQATQRKTGVGSGKKSPRRRKSRSG